MSALADTETLHFCIANKVRVDIRTLSVLVIVGFQEAKEYIEFCQDSNEARREALQVAIIRAKRDLA